MELEKEENKKTRSPYSRPLVLFSVVLLPLQVVLLLFWVPRFSAIYADFGTPLPLPTRIDLGLSRLVQEHLIVAIFVVGLALVALIKAYAWICTHRGQSAAMVVSWVVIPVLVFSSAFIAWAVFLPMITP